MGFASIFMPTLSGIIADRWINAERLYGILQILYAAVLFFLPQVTDPGTFFWVMLIAMCFYMPTIALNNSISYTVLKTKERMLLKISHQSVYGVQLVLLQQCGLPILQEANPMSTNSI